MSLISLRNDKYIICLQTIFAAVSLILVSIPAFNMTGAIIKPLFVCVFGSVIVCVGSLFAKRPQLTTAGGLLIMMCFWLCFALIKQFFLQVEAGFVFKWIYFFYFDKLLMLGAIWLTSASFFCIKRLLDKSEPDEYESFFKLSSIAFSVFYVFLLVYSFVLIRLERGDYPLNIRPFATINEYIDSYSEIPYEVFMMFFGNLFYFTPLGYIFCVKMRNRNKYFKSITIILFPLVAFSLLELSQYIIQNGFCEFDDMLMNSLGFWMGAVLYVISDKLARNISKNRYKHFWC